jgi:acid phosphatase family membrane protein YuiD
MILPIELVCSLGAMFLAQFAKIPLFFLMNRKWDFRIFFSTGGMPSSHAAMVWALTTAVAFTQGIDSTLFAIACVFSTIISYDAMGIRRQAGFHAEAINKIIEDFRYVFTDKDAEYDKKFKVLLGHKPQEVFMGTLLGIITSLVVFLYVLN